MASPAYEKLKQAHPLPSPTGVALEILRLAGDETTTLEAFAKVVESDSAITGRLLQLVNSPFAGVARRIASVSVAVRLLGMRTVKNLTLGFSLLTNHRQGRCPGFDYEEFWSQSLARAVAARGIAHHLKDVPPDEAFTLGLLSEVGRLAFATACPEPYARALSLAGAGGPSRLATVEQEMFGINHDELSAEMLAEWRLPDLFCKVVRYQDAKDAPVLSLDPRAERLIQVLRLAAAVAGVLAQPSGTPDAPSALLDAAARLGMVPGTFHPLFDGMSQEWREAGRIFSVETREVPSWEQLEAQARTTRAAEAPPTATPSAEDPALRILVVDDDPAALRLLERYLTGAGYQVMTASTGEEALNIDLAAAPQMILTDWNMPGMDGLTLCRRLRAHGNLGFAYVIMMTAQAEQARVVEALDAGADEFLAKPFSREELLARVRAGQRVVRLQADLAARSREIAQYNAWLGVTNEKFRALATTDELTGLPNRREAFSRLREQWSLAVRHDDPLACIMADIDRFKQVNDTHGHATGDGVLREAAHRLQQTLRTGEVACRIGGEEFLILCPRSNARAAAQAAERLRLAVAAIPLSCDALTLPVTISLGVAERTACMGSPDDLLRAADEALYAAKAAGRNRVCVAGMPTGPPELRRVVSPTAPEDARAGVVRHTMPPPVPPVRVWVVAANDGSHARYRRTLRSEGCEVSEAHDAPEALALLDPPAPPPDVIVVDNDSLRPHGLECTWRLKAHPLTQDTPVLMVSDHADAGDFDDGLEVGADEYVRQPLQPRELALRICSVARLHRSRAELLNSNEVRGEQARVLGVLLDLSCRLATAGSLDAILERVVAAAAELTCSQRVSVMLPDADGRHLRIVKSVGMAAEVAATVRVPVGGAIAGHVFLDGQPVVVNTIGDVESAGPRYDSLFFVSAPLVSKVLRATNATVGVLNITERCEQRPFSAGELASVDLLCNIAATALSSFLSGEARDQARDAIVVALATLAEYRDVETGRHLDRVTHYALMLAEELRKTGPYGSLIVSVRRTPWRQGDRTARGLPGAGAQGVRG